MCHRCKSCSHLELSTALPSLLFLGVHRISEIKTTRMFVARSLHYLRIRQREINVELCAGSYDALCSWIVDLHVQRCAWSRGGVGVVLFVVISSVNRDHLHPFAVG